MKTPVKTPKAKELEVIEKPKDVSIVMPAVTSVEAVEAWNQYQDLKKAIVEDSDVQMIEKKAFLKKSYWRKIATFFNLSTEVIEEHQEQIGKTFVWHFTVKAIAPNGRFAIGVGSCDAYEKAKLMDGHYMKYNRFKKIYEDAEPNSIHNIRSTAETRATNRAISNLVGGGEVSAEEVDQHSNHDQEEQKTIEEPTEEQKTSWSNRCSEANCEHPDWEVPEKVVEFSNKAFGRTVCYKCQERIKSQGR